MKKSIFLFFAAILCATSVDAKTIYLNTGGSGLWDQAGALFTAKVSDTEYDMTKVFGSYYEGAIPDDATKVTFMRNDPNGGNWNKTDELTIPTDGKNCYTITGWSYGDWSTYTYDPLATDVFLAGQMNGWNTTVNEFRKAAKDDNTATLTLNLAAGNYDFKIVNGGNWLGNNGDITADISGWTFKSGDGDCTLKANIAGDYTFTWAISTSKLSITYPTICAITATANDAAMGTVTGAGNYGKGSTATLTATPNDGYLFVNWTKGGELVSNDKTYSFKVTEAVELVANFEEAAEEVHNVTVSYVCGGNKIAEDQTISAVGVTTAQSVEAPAIFGYTFASWTLGAGVTSSNTTANPISINTIASGSDFTLTANYTEIPKVTVYFVNNKKWSDVYVYGWDGTLDANPGWPGQKITANKEAEKIAGFDVYSYSVVPGSYQKIIFNKGEGGDDNQTKNYKWVDGKYYWHGKADDFEGVTKDYFSVPVVAGNSTPIFGTSWDIENANNEMQEQADGTYKLVKENVELSAGDVEYKVVIGHFTWDESYTSETKNDKGNSVLAINASGKYNVTFTYNPNNDNKVTATAELLEEVIVLPTISVKGAWDGWILHELVTADDDMTASVEVNVTTTGTHQFGFDVDGNFIANGVTIERENNTTTDLTGNSGNMSLVVDQVGNYTFTWTYETNSLEVTFPEKTDEPIVETIYYVRNSANGWNADDASKMEKDGDVYKKTVTFAQGVEFKVANDSWSSSFGYDKLNNQSYKELESGSDGNIKMKEAKTFTIIFNPAEILITFEGLTPAEVKCYLMGNGDWDNGVEMTLNPDNDNEYMLLDHYISAPFKFKLGDEWSDQVENYDFPGIGWDNTNITLPEGYYDFYFKKDIKKAYIAAVYLRDVTNTWGTICLPHASTSFSGAKFYEVSSLDPTKGLWLDEIEAGAQLVAGKPYVFEATASTIKVTYTDKAVATLVEGANGLTGTFTDIAAAEDGVLVGNYIIGGNKVHVATAQNDLPANRAYIDAALVPNKVQAKIPGRRRVCMGENATTGLDQIVAPEGQAVKAIVNGQLIIIRDGVKYNVQGQKL